MGGTILAEAALSFLGLGVRPPYPSWGSMLSEARDQITTAPWLSVFPGLAIFLTVLGLNLLGDGLRDILDPQSRSRAPMTLLAVEDLRIDLAAGDAPPRGGREGQLRDRARRDLRAGRRIRLRQVDHGARHHGAAAAPARDRRRLDQARRPRHRESRRGRAAPAARQAAGDDLPGADDGAQSAAPGGPADRRDVHPARGRELARRRSAAPSRCWRACAFRRPSGARATIRTSSPAACASA